MKNKILFIVLVMAFVACETQLNRTILTTMLNSNDKDSIITACRYIMQKKDTSYYDYLLDRPYDPRVSHNLKFKGKSVYQSKMEALERITGLKSPKKITYEVDSTIVSYYLKMIHSRKK